MMASKWKIALKVVLLMFVFVLVFYSGYLYSNRINVNLLNSNIIYGDFRGRVIYKIYEKRQEDPNYDYYLSLYNGTYFRTIPLYKSEIDEIISEMDTNCILIFPQDDDQSIYYTKLAKKMSDNRYFRAGSDGCVTNVYYSFKRALIFQSIRVRIDEKHYQHYCLVLDY